MIAEQRDTGGGSLGFTTGESRAATMTVARGNVGNANRSIDGENDFHTPFVLLVICRPPFDRFGFDKSCSR